MSKCSFVVQVITQVLLILSVVAAIAAAALWFGRPLWDAPLPPPPRPPSRWRPCRIGHLPIVLWRPENWDMRFGQAGSGKSVAIFQASPAALVGLIVREDSEKRLDLKQVIQEVVAPLAKRPGFWSKPIAGDGHAIGREIAEVASWWELAGLRPLAWHAEIHCRRLGRFVIVSWLMCDHYNWATFAPAARDLIRSVKLLQPEAAQ